MNWNLFFSTFGLIFVAEIPDKTAIAIVLMSAKSNPFGVFAGTALAFLIQCLVAVGFGHLFSLLPEHYVHTGAGILFILFALAMWFQRKKSDVAEEKEVTQKTGGKTFLRAAVSSFLVIFAAEWGDLTQLATATLEAKYHEPGPILLASITALWTATSIAVVIGHHAGKMINQRLLHTVGAIVFFAVGVYMTIKG